MKTIAFDTSNQPLSAAVFQDGNLLEQFETNSPRNHSEQLLPTIDHLLQNQGWQPQDLNQVIVSQGPGSYTGLRLAVTTAKTLAFTLGLELIGISGLALLAANVLNEDTLIIPMMDARNDNVYAGQYRWQAGELVTVKADQHTSIHDLPLAVGAQAVVYVGEYQKFQDMLKKNVPQAQFAEDNFPHAATMLNVSRTATAIQAPAAVHNFNPKYLRVTQAEADWQALNPNAENHDYVEKIK
ncbi:tRNA (adenosine(37)-N6)-threonylcarbamoyltransferase complex dimerization subunit type 1 TsaB [Weissella coleopterorum]|uniref:tRNA (Adenosine(37)-N6)-threonylcarbamoyltransferase complex dimerization subunit type 1 TsaB n=1 Tax=Weissella coleopterorum TaxID=2714949 RepID=A0A6G8AZ27_9LACO|nr:tRNA (adenosine(37)-N6)-threonylcarbamoyltransferase complex dimerization subunit type 1 TsaB [Weissella coleopterorum]QIL50212.1 tRNA (adenosine(37)-N6)-threonylcarbamoyltransferase complex dimerization subunit type 1 TsaB [Weissella coleopterorum]